MDDVSLVLHYDPPTDAKTYLHRSGRTARAGAAGVVVSLLLPDQVGQAKRRFRSAKVGDPAIDRIRPGDQAIADLVAKGVHVEPKERTQRDMRRGPGGPGGRPRRDGDRPPAATVAARAARSATSRVRPVSAPRALVRRAVLGRLLRRPGPALRRAAQPSVALLQLSST